jgi:hypothetical protein
MFALLNQIWSEAGVTHNTFTDVRVHVEAPIYRVATCGFNNGFVEMLPNSVPVDDISVHPKRSENGWKQTNEILPSSVAGFMLIYLLDIRDRHQGNMVVTDQKRFANIDFGWLTEGPSIDAGLFPVPVGLQYLLAYSKLWDEFHDLSWDALKVLYEDFDRIETVWKQGLRELQINDGKWFKEIPRDMKGRVSISRSQLDMELRKFSLATALKNFTHGFGNMMKALGGGGGAATDASGAAQKRLDHRMSTQLLVPESPAKGATASGAAGGGLARTTTESLHGWLAKVHLEQWHDSLVEQYYTEVSILVSSRPETLDAALAKIKMPPPHIDALKAAIAKDPRYVA